ncbi:MAG: type IV secretory system conjugative DNA transfer family protein [Betaproteobacteria bacterium]|nr:type IV secretory system conjugative DNA transfer family protein [Betaproteobacteria bacterium]
MANVTRQPGPQQSLPGVREALAYRNAFMDQMVITGILAFIGLFVGGTVSSWMLGGDPWFFGTPFLPKNTLGFDLYTIMPDLICIFKYKAYPRVQHAAWMGIVIFLCFAACGWYLGAKRARKSRDKLLKSDAHGSAHWAEADEIVNAGLLPDPKSKAKPENAHVCYVGGLLDEKKRLHYLRHSGPEHVIAFAPTRSGKGVGLVLPTLLTWRGSTVVHDIKGENWALTAGWRHSIGQRCLKFAPTLSDGTCCHFNPLNEIRVGTDKEVSDVQNIATMIVDPDGKGLNDHWAKTGFALLVGSILHVLYAREITSKTLRAVANLLSDPSVAAVDEIFEMMKSYEHDPAGRQGWVDLQGNRTTTHPVVAQSAQEMLNKADNEKSGVISTAMSFLSLYRDPVVAANIERSDFKIEDLMGDAKGERIPPIALYLVVPPSDKDRLKPLIRLILNQIVRRLTESMEFKDGRSVAGYQHRLLLMIDEFPSLGKLDIFAESLAYVAGYGMKMYLICQDTAQLYKEYTKDETIIPNCHVRVVYAPNKLETAEWLSKMLGKRTLVTENTTFSYNGQFMPYQTGMSGGLQYQARELLTTEEVMSLRGPTKDAQGNILIPGDMITLVAGHAPIYGTQMLYFKDPTFDKRAKLAPPDSAEVMDDDFQSGCTAAVVSAESVAQVWEQSQARDAAQPAPDAAAPAAAQPSAAPTGDVNDTGSAGAKAPLTGLDALDAAAFSEADLEESDDDHARALEEARLLSDRMRAIEEVHLREEKLEREHASAWPDMARSRTAEHRRREKEAFRMLAGSTL